MPEKTLSLTRGSLARQTGVHAETLRYYEKRGLLVEPPRGASNYRLYPGEAVGRIRFIKRAQELGFTLGEIGELLALRANARGRNSTVKALAELKAEMIDGKIRDLKRMKKALSALAASCDGAGSISECPIIAALEEK